MRAFREQANFIDPCFCSGFQPWPWFFRSVGLCSTWSWCIWGRSPGSTRHQSRNMFESPVPFHPISWILWWMGLIPEPLFSPAREWTFPARFLKLTQKIKIRSSRRRTSGCRIGRALSDSCSPFPARSYFLLRATYPSRPPSRSLYWEWPCKTGCQTNRLGRSSISAGFTHPLPFIHLIFIWFALLLFLLGGANCFAFGVKAVFFHRIEGQNRWWGKQFFAPPLLSFYNERKKVRGSKNMEYWVHV